MPGWAQPDAHLSVGCAPWTGADDAEQGRKALQPPSADQPLTSGRPSTAVLTLKQLGMDNTRESALQVHRYCQAHFDGPVALVGHSQGALAAAWLWLHHSDDYTPPFMLAGPWAGALLCQTWLPLGAALRSMSAESRFLRGDHRRLQQPAG